MKARNRIVWWFTLLGVLAFLLLPLWLFAQDPGSAPASGAASGASPDAPLWIKIISAVTAVVLAARAIVKLTPTPADDSYLEKVLGWLKHLGLHLGALPLLLSLSFVVLAGTACVGRKGDIVTSKTTVLGFQAKSPGQNGTEIVLQLGLIRSDWKQIPTSTNELHAPDYVSRVNANLSLTRQFANEDIATGSAGVQRVPDVPYTNASMTTPIPLPAFVTNSAAK